MLNVGLFSIPRWPQAVRMLQLGCVGFRLSSFWLRAGFLTEVNRWFSPITGLLMITLMQLSSFCAWMSLIVSCNCITSFYKIKSKTKLTCKWSFEQLPFAQRIMNTLEKASTEVTWTPLHDRSRTFFCPIQLIRCSLFAGCPCSFCCSSMSFLKSYANWTCCHL